MASSSSTSGASSSSVQPRSSTMVILTSLTPILIRLDRDNYAYWRSQVLPAVSAHELEEFLLGTRVRPPVMVDLANPSLLVPNSYFGTWLRPDQFVMS